MSALIHLKQILIEGITEPRLKKPALDLINAIDADLNEQGYEHSSEVDEAIKGLDNAIMEIDEEQHPTPALMDVASTPDEDDDNDGEGNLLGNYGAPAEEEET